VDFLPDELSNLNSALFVPHLLVLCFLALLIGVSEFYTLYDRITKCAAKMWIHSGVSIISWCLELWTRLAIELMASLCCCTSMLVVFS